MTNQKRALTSPTPGQVQLAHGLIRMHTRRLLDNTCAWCALPWPCSERSWSDQTLLRALEAGSGR